MSDAPSGGHFSAYIRGRNPLLEGRTVRAFSEAGGNFAGFGLDDAALAHALESAEGNVAFSQAGVWFPGRRAIPEFPSDGEWIAAGAWLGDDDNAAKWARALTRCGGDLSRLSWWRKRPPAPPAMLLSRDASRRFGAVLRSCGSLENAWIAMFRAKVRVVHLAELDAHFSAGLRVLQIVTSIQIGGAERVALDLTAAVPSHGAASLLVALGKPMREAFPAPAGFVSLSASRNDPAGVAEGIRRIALEFGADVVHAHLIRAAEARAIRATGLPTMLHIHNFPEGWPPDYGELSPKDATLLLPCAQKVDREVARLLPQMSARTIWNGIASSPAPAGPARDAFTVVTLANPRLQKRLDRIPEIARATATLLAPRRVRFVIAGAREPYSADSAAAIAALDAAILQHDAGDIIERPGLIADTTSLLAQADAMLSVSAYEGLSLAHLEALSAGVPVVATDAGGTSEIAEQSDALTLLPIDATAAQFASALAACKSGMASLPASFLRHKMAARAAWLASAVVRRERRGKGDGLWLIANNFSTGGAQSSARRLLLALKERGVRVRAAVIQEQPEFPTPGRRALMDAGIPVIAVESVETLLDAIESDPPEAVFFWNVITSWKILLADALLDMRVFDISPGEMLFSSLDRYFENPPAGIPYRTATDYGSRLAGLVVKYHAEAGRAAKLGCAVHVIRNGVPLLPPVVREPNAVLVLGTAARLSPDKKLGDLLAAVRLAAPQMPPFLLRIAGGPERDFPAHASELRELAAGLPVEWMGEVADMPTFLGGLDIFAMISEPAGCPNAILEASAAGLPVIATDHGGARELVIESVTGRICPRGDPQSFAEALLALAHGPTRREEMGRAARIHMEKEFAISKMADLYRALISDVTKVPYSR